MLITALSYFFSLKKAFIPSLIIIKHTSIKYIEEIIIFLKLIKKLLNQKICNYLILQNKNLIQKTKF